jgi:hypothetical protein
VKIAFLHYHLKPGGVTTVLRHQVDALVGYADCIILSGAPPPSSFACPVYHIPGIGYDGGEAAAPPEKTAAAIKTVVHDHFGGPCDLLHIHNPILAKNHLFLDIIKSLQQSGLRLFLQVHDFAEDGRPGVYFRDVDYPQDCHYGVINLRDYHILINSGLDPEGLHHLPNCVVPFVFPPVSRTASYVLYPVRAIRRKNIGEVLLISLFLPKNDAIHITLPPNSPADFPSYNHWRSYVETHHLPVCFEMGTRGNFQNLVAAAQWILTTSIAEGFGFAFLEPWTAGKLLNGRILPEICREFSNHGIRLEHLYADIKIPQDWIGIQRIADRFRACLAVNRQAFGDIWPDDWLEDCLHTLQQSETIDFGMLDERFQTTIIDKIRQDSARRDEMIQLNPILETMFSMKNTSEIINRNRDQVVSRYHPDRYRERLIDIYTHILENPVQQCIDRKALLAAFLNFHNFSLLKWSPYHG